MVSALLSRLLPIGEDEGDQVDVPEPVYRVLVRAVETLSHGKGMKMAPHEPQLSLQQAADLPGGVAPNCDPSDRLG